MFFGIHTGKDIRARALAPSQEEHWKHQVGICQRKSFLGGHILFGFPHLQNKMFWKHNALLGKDVRAPIQNHIQHSHLHRSILWDVIVQDEEALAYLGQTS